MEAIATKYNLSLPELTGVIKDINIRIGKYDLIVDTLLRLNIQLQMKFGKTLTSHCYIRVDGYKQLSLDSKEQLLNDIFKVIKDSYKLQFSKEFTLICNKVVKNYDTVDEIKNYYDICIELGRIPTIYKNGKNIKAEELIPIKTISFNQLILSDCNDSAYVSYKYKNITFQSFIHYKVEQSYNPWVLYTSQKDMQFLIKGDFPKNTKGIVYHYKDKDEKSIIEIIIKSLSGFPPIIMVDVLTESIKNEILEFLL
jgi:hypothetical protein